MHHNLFGHFFPIGQQHVDKLSDRILSTKRLKFRVASAEASLLDYAESREIS